MRNTRFLIGLSMVLAVSLFAFLLVSQSRGDGLSERLEMADERALPSSAEQIVAQNEVVVIGSVVTLLGTSVEVIPIPTDEMTEMANEPLDMSSDYTRDVTDFAFLVSDILKSELEFHVGDVITLRVDGFNNTNRPPNVGATYLLMGGSSDHYPANMVSPLGGNQGLFLAHDLSATVQYSYGDPVPWATGQTVQQLIDEIELLVGD